jgi:hypothetical protein
MFINSCASCNFLNLYKTNNKLSSRANNSRADSEAVGQESHPAPEVYRKAIEVKK